MSELLEQCAAFLRDNPTQRTITIFENYEPIVRLTREDIVALYLANEARIRRDS